jgi:hypothetical protein
MFFVSRLNAQNNAPSYPPRCLVVQNQTLARAG